MTWKIGCTGGIACGKTEATARMRVHGIPVLDTDRVAHEVMAPGTPVTRRVVERFGPGVVEDGGRLNRKALGDLVFSDPAALRDLNRLVHPEVGRRWRKWLADRTGPVAVVVIPLLVETGGQHDFDDVLCISSTESLMIQRLLSRGLSPEQARDRIQSQLPLEQKERHATWILKNNGSLEAFHRAVDAWIETVVLSENPPHD